MNIDPKNPPKNVWVLFSPTEGWHVYTNVAQCCDEDVDRLVGYVLPSVRRPTKVKPVKRTTGEMIDMMIDGTLCQNCGDAFDDHETPGHSRTCSACKCLV